MAVAAATLLAAICVAGYIPASRASKIDPLTALRVD
jgi:ABC-type antimicrobial peptide transport system permease subunit